MTADQIPSPVDAMGSFVTGLRRWSENMSATARRQATSVSASKLRQWVNRTLEERPSRGELRAWIELVLDECRALHNKAEALTKENEALTAQRDDALEELAAVNLLRFKVEGLEQTVAHVCRARDEAHEVGAMWRRRFETVEHELDTIQAQRDEAREALKTLDVDRTRRARERDTAERNLHERTVEMTKAYEELRGVYDQAEGERNTFARENRRLREELVELRRDQVAAVCADVEEVEGRVECDHGVGVNFTTLRLTTPGGGAK